MTKLERGINDLQTTNPELAEELEAKIFEAMQGHDAPISED